MLLTLGASLLGIMLAGKGVIRARYGSKGQGAIGAGYGFKKILIKKVLVLPHPLTNYEIQGY